MEIYNLKELLKQQIDQLKELHDSLDESGKVPLTVQEKKMCRNVIADTWLQEMLNEIEIFARSGTIKGIEGFEAHLISILKPFV